MGAQRAELRARAHKIQRLTDLYCKLGLIVYTCLLAKNLLIIALDWRYAARLRWLDCLLIGRLQMTGRIPKVSKYCAVVIDCVMLINRRLFARFGEDLQLIIEQFISFQPTAAAAGPAASEKRRFMLDSRVANPLSPMSAPLNRPNRDRDWHRSERLLIFACFVACLVSCLIYLIALALITSPMLVTRRGFELLYPNCVSWIVRRAANNSLAQCIYRVDPTRSMADLLETPEIPFQLPLIDLVPLNAYHVARFAADALELWLGQVDIIFYYALHVFLVLRISFDLLIYLAHLKRQLASLAQQLALLPRSLAHTCTQRNCPCATMPALHVAGAGVHHRHEPQLIALQGHLLDYFRFVRAYNPYVGAISLVHTSVWFFYAHMLAARYLKSRRLAVELDEGVHLEYFSMLLGTFAPVLITMLAQFVVSARACQLYALIARVMALDPGGAHTRLRWATLLKFYQPRSLHCFTMLNGAALCWLFGLKLLFWVLSALLVLRSI